MPEGLFERGVLVPELYLDRAPDDLVTNLDLVDLETRDGRCGVGVQFVYLLERSIRPWVRNPRAGLQTASKAGIDMRRGCRSECCNSATL
jgi:hypothetical protein